MASLPSPLRISDAESEELLVNRWSWVIVLDGMECDWCNPAAAEPANNCGTWTRPLGDATRYKSRR